MSQQRPPVGEGKRPTLTPEGLSQRTKDMLELPVDRGWAWVICLAGFLTYFLITLANQATVVMFIELTILFDTTITTASLVFTVTVLFLSFTSIIATNVITPRIGEKAMVAIAGVLLASGSAIYAVAPTIWVFLGAAMIKGVAFGCAFVPCLNLIRLYFHKRRGIATTLSNVGASVSVIVFPPLVPVLRKEFGIRGTYLILSALELHLVAAALLMRPVSFYKYRPQLQPLKRQAKRDSQNAENGLKKLAEDQEMGELNGNVNIPKDESHALVEPRRNVGTPKEESHGMAELNGNVSSPKEEGHEDEVKQILLTVDSNERTIAKDSSKTSPHDDQDRRQEIQRYASMVSLADEPAPGALDLATRMDSEERSNTSCADKCNNSIFGLWSFRLVLFSTVFGCIHQYVRNYIPTIAKTQGATFDEAALLMPVMGSVDLVSRILVGLFADTHILKPSQIIIISQIGLGIMCHLLRFFTTYETQILMAVGIGVFIGTRLTLGPMLSFEVVGVEKMPQAYSVLATLTTLLVAGFNPLYSSIAEAQGNFVLVLHIVGILVWIGGLLFLAMPFMARLDAKNGRKNKP